MPESELKPDSINRRGFRVINCLGVGISAVNLQQATQLLGSWADCGKRCTIHLCTAHTVIECHQEPTLRHIINQADLVAPDGMPLAWLCRFLKQKHATRVYGPDLMRSFCEHSVTRGYRHFFYGGAVGVAGELAARLKQRYPGLQIAGIHTPPYRPVGAIEETTVIEAINALKPDIIWVGLGTPKQDYWVAQHRPFLSAPLLVPVGAAFDMLSGRVQQAPPWMQRSGLEWLFRLSREPRRLARRYLVYNPLFALHLFLQLTRLRHYPLSGRTR